MDIIGMDFGNNYSFTSYIPRFDPSVSRLGGNPVALMRDDLNDGYPSVFFYSKAVADNCRRKSIVPPPWYGLDAVRTQAKPAANRLRNFKRHMNKPFDLDDLSSNYDELITNMIQYLMRQSNEVLKNESLQTSNLLSLAYPATFTTAKQLHLKELAEKATLEDGTKIRVVGMIAEPAAAALDYLVEHGRADKETTVLVYDLGGGTFDLSVVTAYPQGRKAANGGMRYFDVEKTGGLEELGGTEFDKAMLRILERKVDQESITTNPDILLRLAESAKRDLSSQLYTECDLSDLSTGEMVTLEITREEFESEAASLMKQTIDETRRFLTDYSGKGPAPEMIVLTGGSSHMPMVQRELEKAFPQFAGKVQLFRPSRAISYGAARYSQNPTSVQTYTTHDIGIQFFRHDTDILYVETYIPAGTPLPFETNWSTSVLREDDVRCSVFPIMEAKVPHPDSLREEDYTRVFMMEMYHEPGMHRGDPTESRMILDKSGLLRVEARDPAKPSKPPVRCELQINMDSLSTEH